MVCGERLELPTAPGRDAFTARLLQPICISARDLVGPADSNAHAHRTGFSDRRVCLFHHGPVVREPRLERGCPTAAASETDRVCRFPHSRELGTAAYPCVMRAGGLEPPRRRRRSLLRRPRLPFPSRARGCRSWIRTSIVLVNSEAHDRHAARHLVETFRIELKSAACKTAVLPLNDVPVGTPKWIQTTDLRVRSAALCSPEL